MIDLVIWLLSKIEEAKNPIKSILELNDIVSLGVLNEWKHIPKEHLTPFLGANFEKSWDKIIGPMSHFWMNILMVELSQNEIMKGVCMVDQSDFLKIWYACLYKNPKKQSMNTQST